MHLRVQQALAALILSATVFVSEHVRADVISFRSDFWCPYVCNPDSETPGYMVEITRAVFEKQGHKVQVKLSNWVRAIKDTRSNRVQGLMGCSVVDAPDFIYPKKSLGLMKNAYFVPKNSTWTYKGRPSLQGMKIGVINGYTYGDSVDNLIRSRHRSFIPFSGDRPLEQVIRMMQAGRLDGFIENPVVLQYTSVSAKITMENMKIGGWVENHDPALFISFSPNNPKSQEYAEILSRGVEELRRSGELQRILMKYNLKDWEQPSGISLGALDNLGSSFLKSPLNPFNMFNARSL
ncbi:transporter substrate-binding domain-containing protein [Bdellovibrio bacteriovorus]|uniref:ABC transporter, periplasmic domain n=1 Tax=Bdellovibrio bacteriovorus (strain ATCC 15356 / DSM 50701 / NCIMB 9529 / HD100) TaxID=264462 RepID=Q6MP13_BDEBA|nr:transporter substrate-binding domain-containing protein [Bdellovibrio bacteriovorus]CAE78985.1 ABC transporter, periplasmic domain [Bdellovibrio bacteriovorus HD100]